ncbi:MAG: hypothetical protein RQ751_14665, partial [Longimicrobiales bacterium]|nr:hypothetical protein [Longimicrobiales bacterium]
AACAARFVAEGARVVGLDVAEPAEGGPRLLAFHRADVRDERAVAAAVEAAEREAGEAGEPVQYPSFEEMRAEDREQDPYLLFTITDTDGDVVRRLTTRPGTGIQRITWDLRYGAVGPITGGSFNPFDDGGYAPLVAPGTYNVSMAKVVDGVPTTLVEPVSFQVVPLNNATLATDDREALVAFQQEAADVMAEVRTT